MLAPNSAACERPPISFPVLHKPPRSRSPDCCVFKIEHWNCGSCLLFGSPPSALRCFLKAALDAFQGLQLQLQLRSPFRIYSRFQWKVVARHRQHQDLPFHMGTVAQRLEQRTHNPLVLGSNPSGPTFVFARTGSHDAAQLRKRQRVARLVGSVGRLVVVASCRTSHAWRCAKIAALCAALCRLVCGCVGGSGRSQDVRLVVAEQIGESSHGFGFLTGEEMAVGVHREHDAAVSHRCRFLFGIECVGISKMGLSQLWKSP